jgi:hypothetical protein
VCAVLLTAGVSVLVGWLNFPDFRAAASICALCSAYPSAALSWKVFVTGHTLTIDARGQDSIEVVWMHRAGAGACLDVLVATLVTIAVLLVTEIDVASPVLLAGLAVLTAADAGARYLIIRHRAG